jgi:UDP-GlcNAc:undecaprenyl-phosphate/decaprenyl-phosphate GlcNAc-1-phosphate transferase
MLRMELGGGYEAWPCAFLLSAGLIALLMKPALRIGWADRPSTRKHHHGPVPLVGGVAICAAFSLSVFLQPEKPQGYPELLMGAILLTAVGLYDDVRSIRPAVRFLFQIGAALWMVYGGGVVLIGLGDLFGLGPVYLGSIAVLFTVFGVVGAINALNMSDGLDGLAGGLALIAVAWLIVLNWLAPSPHAGDLNALLGLAMAIAGFLMFNLRHPWRTRASTFMGDAGSTLLGFALVWFMVRLSQGEGAVMAPMTAVWILALPVLDTVTVMVRRIRAGRNPCAADRQHLHHLLLGESRSDGRVTAILLAVAAATGALGVAAWWLRVPESLQFYAFLGVFLMYYRFTTRMWARRQTAGNARDMDAVLVERS